MLSNQNVSRIRFGAVNMSRQCLFDYRWLHQLSCLYTLKWVYEEDTIHPHTAVFSNPVTYIPVSYTFIQRICYYMSGSAMSFMLHEGLMLTQT